MMHKSKKKLILDDLFLVLVDMWSKLNLKVLPPKDFRNGPIYYIVKNLFSELTFDITSLLICEEIKMNEFHVYFTGISEINNIIFNIFLKRPRNDSTLFVL